MSPHLRETESLRIAAAEIHNLQLHSEEKFVSFTVTNLLTEYDKGTVDSEIDSAS